MSMSAASIHSQQVREFRDLLEGNADFEAWSSDPLLSSDLHLQRFVVARNGKLEDSKKMLLDHFAWRKENNVDEIRKQVQDKPHLAASFPYAEELKPFLLGSWNSIVDAGLSRTNDVVFIEALGLKRDGKMDDNNKELMDKLIQHQIGFFESRSIHLEQLSEKQQRIVRTVQLRDVSWLSFMPGGGALGIARKIIQIGMLNYPELAGTVLFINPPTIFSAVFALIKPFFPAEVERKFRFLSGTSEQIARDLLKYVRPRNIVGWNRLIQGYQVGDDIQQEIEMLEAQPMPWEKEFTRQVNARSTNILAFTLTEALPNLTWRLVTAAATTSEDGGKIVGKVYFANPKQEGVSGKELEVLVGEVDNDTGTASLPSQTTEALVILVLDNTSSWLTSKQFIVRVTAS